MIEGIYEVYINKNVVEAKGLFERKYGYIPNDVQRQGDVMLAGPIDLAKLWCDVDDEEDE